MTVYILGGTRIRVYLHTDNGQPQLQLSKIKHQARSQKKQLK